MTWQHTHTGRAFDLLVPSPADVSLIDISAALSRLCRYNGHSRTHASVAEHSCRVSDRLRATHGDAIAWKGLCHDAHEAYIGDWTSPVKLALRSIGPCRELVELEQRVWAAVAAALSVDEETGWDAVKAADLDDLRREAPGQLPWPPPRPWDVTGMTKVDDLGWVGWEPRHAQANWMRRAVDLAPTKQLKTEAMRFWRAAS
jgi:uncharacterized protein